MEEIMGLLAPLAELIMAEHTFRPIEGKVLFIGRQTVHLNDVTHNSLLSRHNLQNKAITPPEYDRQTRGAMGQELITDRYFMKSLGIEKVDFLDVTDYEGAEIIHDLGQPVPERFHSSYDFIYNGGCLDNMFNPGIALMNMSMMLRSGGRLLCMESASSWNSPYLIYSPAWFYDYYVMNAFADCKVYLMSYKNNEELFYGPWDMYHANLDADPNGPSPEAIYDNHLLVVTIAEKGPSSTSTVQPVQAQYRTNPIWVGTYNTNASQMKKHPRPIIRMGFERHDKKEYLWYLGKLGQGLNPTQPARLCQFRKFPAYLFRKLLRTRWWRSIVCKCSRTYRRLVGY